MPFLTCDAEDVPNVWDEDDQHVDDKQQTHRDGDVAQPVEGPLGEQQLQEGTADLQQPSQGAQRVIDVERKLRHSKHRRTRT